MKNRNEHEAEMRPGKFQALKLIKLYGEAELLWKRQFSVADAQNDRQGLVYLSWALSLIAEQNPLWNTAKIQPFLYQLLEKYSKDVSVTRNLLKFFSLSVPVKSIEARLLDRCLRRVVDKSIKPAEWVYSMEIIWRLALKYPDLIPELKTIVLFTEEEDRGAAISSKCRTLKKRIIKIKAWN